MKIDHTKKQLLAVKPLSFQLKEKEFQRQQIIKINKRDSTPVLKELSKVGIQVEWISDLYSQKLINKKCIPILLHWLPLVENKDVKEDIVRALSIPWAKPIAAPVLIKEFRKLRNFEFQGLKWAIGNALAVVADDTVFTDIVDLVSDRRYGRSREMLVVALGNMKDLRSQHILINLLEDDEVVGYAIMALGRF